MKCDNVKGGDINMLKSITKKNCLTQRELDILLREHRFLKKYDIIYSAICEREERENSTVLELSTSV